MIKIQTTDVRIGDYLRTIDGEGIVTKAKPNEHIRFAVTIQTQDGVIVRHMSPWGSVELVSDLDGRMPVESFGRW